MITVIRKQLKTKGLQAFMFIFVVITCIAFLVQDGSIFFQPHDWVVSVDGVTKSAPEYEHLINKYNFNVRLIYQQYGAYADMFIKALGLSGDLRSLALDEMIRNSIIDNVANKVPVYINEQYIEKSINSPQLAQQTGIVEVLPLGVLSQQGLDAKGLLAYLSSNHMTMKEFDILVENALARYITLRLAGLASYVPSFMVKDYITSKYSLKNYTILEFSFDKVKQQEELKEVSDQELEVFFEAQNKASKRYWYPEMRTAKVWEFVPDKYDIEISEELVQEYYEKNKAKKYVLEPAKVHVRRILLKIPTDQGKQQVKEKAQLLYEELLKDPSKFESMAKQHSDDTDSSKKGGQLPFFAKGERDPLFERKAFILSNDGDLSDVFESKEGYEIIQRIEKKGVVYRPFMIVKEEIKKLLLQQQFGQAFVKDAKKIVTENTDALEALAQKRHGVVTLKSDVIKDDTKLAQMIFKLKKDRVDFFIENNKGYIVLVTNIKRKYQPELNAMRAQVQQDLIHKRAELSLQKKVAQAKKDMKQKSASEIAKEYGAFLKSTGLLSIDDAKKIDQLQKDGIPTQTMLQAENKGDIVSTVQKNGYIIELSEVDEPSVTLYEQEKDASLVYMNNELMGLFIQGFVASLSRNVKIETNEQLLN